jgi:hypothetical protein
MLVGAALQRQGGLLQLLLLLLPSLATSRSSRLAMAISAVHACTQSVWTAGAGCAA